jgi:hypothetical protein
MPLNPGFPAIFAAENGYCPAGLQDAGSQAHAGETAQCLGLVKKDFAVTLADWQAPVISWRGRLR